MLIGTFWLLVWMGAVGLVLLAWIRLRKRFRAHVHPRPVVDDAAVRRILETGVLVSDEDEPLDMLQVQEEERRFWLEMDGEVWDEAEEAEEW